MSPNRLGFKAFGLGFEARLDGLAADIDFLLPDQHGILPDWVVMRQCVDEVTDCSVCESKAV